MMESIEKPPYDELLRCLENDWHISASWDGLRKFWNIELTEEGVRCRDCIYYMQDPDPIDPGWPMMCERTGDDMVEPYGFCAWGEKKGSLENGIR